VERALNLGSSPRGGRLSPVAQHRSRTPSPPKARETEFTRNVTRVSPRLASPREDRVRAEVSFEQDLERRRKLLNQIFSEFDLDGSDTVDEDELMELGKCRRTLGHKSTDWTREKNLQMMQKMGGGRTVNSQQFVNYFAKSLSGQQPDEFNDTAQQFLMVARACRAKKQKLKYIQQQAAQARRTPSPPMIRPQSPSTGFADGVEHLRTPALIVSGNHVTRVVNRAATNSLGLQNIIGRSFIDHCVVSSYRSAARAAIDSASQGEPAHCEVCVVSKPNTVLSLVATPSSFGEAEDGAKWRHAELQRCFEAFDGNGNGVVDVSELMLLGRMRRTLGQKHGTWTAEKNERLLRALDPHATGAVGAQRFIEYFNAKLPVDEIEFMKSTKQFMQVAAAVQSVRQSGHFDPHQLEAEVEKYCMTHVRTQSPPRTRRGGSSVMIILTQKLMSQDAEAENAQLRAEIKELRARLRDAQANDALGAMQEREQELMKAYLELQQQLAAALEEIKALRMNESGVPSSLDVAVILLQDNPQATIVDSNSTAKHRFGELNAGESFYDSISRPTLDALNRAIAAVRRGETSGLVEIKHISRDKDPTSKLTAFTVVKRNEQILLLSLDASWMLRPGTFVWEMETKMIGGNQWNPAPPLYYPAPPLPYHVPSVGPYMARRSYS